MEKLENNDGPRIYLSGPIGKVVSQEQFDAIKKKFQMAEAAIRRDLEVKPIIFNPTENGLPWSRLRSEHMKVDTTALSNSTAIYLFGDWVKSEGCLFELQAARQFGLDILHEHGTPDPDTIILTYKGAKLVSVWYTERIEFSKINDQEEELYF